MDVVERLNQLDLTVFENIPSETDAKDRRSLLAVQRATARQYGTYNYLEIGSHLGGTIQPYWLDPRCQKIYSIDPRPMQMLDDREPGYVAVYNNNSTERMLKLLTAMAPDGTTKIHCFELDAAAVPIEQINPRAHLILIDGEHTERAVLSDFEFCYQTLWPGGTIVFHDFSIIYPALNKICTRLRTAGIEFIPLWLDREVFGLFFIPTLVTQDPHLACLYARHKGILRPSPLLLWLRKHLPLALKIRLVRVRNFFTGN